MGGRAYQGRVRSPRPAKRFAAHGQTASGRRREASSPGSLDPHNAVWFAAWQAGFASDSGDSSTSHKFRQANYTILLSEHQTYLWNWAIVQRQLHVRQPLPSSFDPGLIRRIFALPRIMHSVCMICGDTLQHRSTQQG